MSKKTNQKKKVNIRLKNGESFFIEDIDVILHIQKTYANLLRAAKSDYDRVVCNRIIEAVNSAIENTNNTGNDGLDDENYWI
jgi:hypothetical protein